MGIVTSKVTSAANKALSWVLETGPSGPLDYESTVSHLNKKNQMDITKDQEPKIIIDPMLLSQDPKIREALHKMREVMILTKVPDYTLNIPLHERGRFEELLNWINQNSDGKYVMLALDKDRISVCQLQMPRKLHTAVGPKTEQTSIITEDPVTYSDSRISGHTSQKKQVGLMELPNLTANGQFLLSQLTAGIFVPPRNKRWKKMKITLWNFDLSELDVIHLIKENPNIDMVSLLRKIYLKTGGIERWREINNFYEVSKFEVINP